METRKSLNKTMAICIGALFIAVFAAASNVPILSTIYLIPNIPFTFQIFLIVLMGLVLGLKNGLETLTALLLLTLCGLPLMSGGHGGPSVFVGPTAGYIYGWYFIVLTLGFYRDHWMDYLINQKIWRMPLHIPVAFGIGTVGILFDYFCGSIGLALYSGKTLEALPKLYFSNFIFFGLDIIKIFCAVVIAMLLFNSALFPFKRHT